MQMSWRLQSMWAMSASAVLLSGCVVSKSSYLKEKERADTLDGQVALCHNQLNVSQQNSAEIGQRLQATQQTAEDLAREKKEQDELVNTLANEIQSSQVKIQQIAGKVSINMVDKILFDSGSARLKPEGQQILMKVGAALQKVQDKRIWVGGHTDDIAISPGLRDRFATNWELSSARATAVVRYLQDKAGLPGDKLLAVGHGQFQPVGDNKTPEGRQQNRRIEILLIPTRETLQSIKA